MTAQNKIILSLFLPIINPEALFLKGEKEGIQLYIQTTVQYTSDTNMQFQLIICKFYLKRSKTHNHIISINDARENPNAFTALQLPNNKLFKPKLK